MNPNQIREQLKLTRDLIGQRYFQTMCLKDLASKTKMSQFHFQRAYKHAFHETPLEHQNRLRLARTKTLLLQNPSIKAVCVEVGFQSPSSFSAWFFRRVGLSPSFYQKYARQKHIPYEVQNIFIPACFLRLYRHSTLELQEQDSRGEISKTSLR
jgi:AraC-like DNA-binding protein